MATGCEKFAYWASVLSSMTRWEVVDSQSYYNQESNDRLKLINNSILTNFYFKPLGWIFCWIPE